MDVTRLEHDDFHWVHGEGGADDVRRIADQAAHHDGREALNEAAVLELQHHGLATSIVLTGAPRPGARAEGFAFLHGLSGTGRPELDLVVAPRHRGQGLGTALATAILEVADGIPMTAWSHGNHPAAAALAAALGFRPVRELWLMRRHGSAPIPEAGRPSGSRIRTYRGSDDDEEILEVNARAFADHPEQGRMDRAGLRERMAEPWFDPSGLFVGETGGRVGGFHWTKVHPAGPGTPAYGEVYVIGVDPSAQGDGLGRALLVAGLDHLHRVRGVDEVVLYVEGSNDGAVRLYESFGFTHSDTDTDVMYASGG